MYAAPTAEFINFSRSGVDLIPGAPAPQGSAVDAYFGPVVSVIEPILPYSVAIKNNNDTAVAELVVRWTLASSAGIKITDTGHFKFVGTHLRTGEMILMAAENHGDLSQTYTIKRENPSPLSALTPYSGGIFAKDCIEGRNARRRALMER